MHERPCGTLPTAGPWPTSPANPKVLRAVAFCDRARQRVRLDTECIHWPCVCWLVVAAGVRGSLSQTRGEACLNVRTKYCWQVDVAPAVDLATSTRMDGSKIPPPPSVGRRQHRRARASQDQLTLVTCRPVSLRGRAVSITTICIPPRRLIRGGEHLYLRRSMQSLPQRSPNRRWASLSPVGAQANSS